MKNLLFLLMIIFVMTMVSGCGSYGPRYQPEEYDFKKNGLIYVFWGCDVYADYKQNAQLRINGPSIHISKRDLGWIYPNSYIPIELPPGSYTLKLTGNWNLSIPEFTKEINVASGDVKYLHYLSKWESGNAYLGGTLSHRFGERSASDARKYLNNCQLNNEMYQQLKSRPVTNS